MTTSLKNEIDDIKKAALSEVVVRCLPYKEMTTDVICSIIEEVTEEKDVIVAQIVIHPYNYDRFLEKSKGFERNSDYRELRLGWFGQFNNIMLIFDSHMLVNDLVIIYEDKDSKIGVFKYRIEEEK